MYCDIDIEDLNISYESLVEKYNYSKASCVIVPSLYGNPANLSKIEKFCREHNIYMIDDSAQSFGAKLDNRMLSSFGDAGLFAFSPGKSTPAPMGALYWCNSFKETKKYTRHRFIHKIIYKNFYENRMNIYISKLPAIIKKLINFSALFLEKYVDITFDCMEDFENLCLGGVIESCLSGKFDYRNYFFNQFIEKFNDTDNFKIIRNIRGKATPHKIVILMRNIIEAKDFSTYLLEHGIYTYDGYKPKIDLSSCPITKAVIGRIIEIPIENDSKKMEYLFNTIQNYLLKRSY